MPNAASKPLSAFEICRSNQRRRVVNLQPANKHTTSATPASVDKELEEEEELELAALRELGLPLSFGVSRNVGI